MTTFTKNLELTVSEEQMELIKKELNIVELYWDRGDSFTEQQAIRIVKGEYFDVTGEIWDWNLDHICDMEREEIIRACKVHLDEDMVDEFESELQEMFRDFVTIDCNFDDLARCTSDVPVRIEMLSNHDCINSHYFEGGYGYEDSYFGDIVDFMNMNPYLLKKELIKNEVKVWGKWPNKKSRNGKEMVSYQEFVLECLERSSPACLWTVLARVKVQDFIDVAGKELKPHIITIPKGNPCGFYSEWQGGGSLVEAKLLNDMTIDLRKHGHTKFDRCQMVVDGDSGYSLEYAFGVYKSFFGENLTIEFSKDEN